MANQVRGMSLAPQASATRGNVVSNVINMAKSPKMVERFSEVLKDKGKASQFLAGVTSAVNLNPKLKDCEPNSVMASAMVAATLNLDVIPGLGFAALVPYGGKCQFQMMYKGFIQLAMRTGQYKLMNVTEVYEDELNYFNPITSEIDLKPVKNGFRDNNVTSKIVGYAAYFKLISGYEHTEYWTKERVLAHGQRYSKSFFGKDSRWQVDFDAMAKKTVLKAALSKWGILSVELQKAVVEDQKTYTDLDKEGIYEDNISEVVVAENPKEEVQVEQPKPVAEAKQEEPTVAPTPSVQMEADENEAFLAQQQMIEEEGSLVDDPNLPF